MSIFAVVILGIVEGFTEFLPISSTAHLVLTAGALGLKQGDYLKSFEIIIQSGAILAVLALYWRRFLDVEVLKRLAVAFLPTGVIGLLLYKTLKHYLLGNTNVVLYALFFGGVFLIVFEQLHKKSPRAKDVATLSYKNCFLIGLCQSVALIPGVSRAAATIIGGMMLGLSRKTIVEFSFLLAVPTMLAATGLDLVKNASSFSSEQFFLLLVGLVSSFAMALLSIKFLLSYIRRNTFTAFGVYRVALVLGLLVV